MQHVMTALSAAALAATVLGPARAAELEMLPSGICQAPLYEVYLDSARSHPGRTVSTLSGTEQWERAFTAVMARYRKGDVLELTHDAQRNALRLCDWDRPVHFLAPRGVVCTYAGGVRETR